MLTINFKTVLSSSYKLAKATYRFITHNPAEALTAFLYFQAKCVAALQGQQAVALAAYNQSPLLLPDFAFNAICYPEDELEIYYHVVTNAPSLRYVKRFVFNEWHPELAHHQRASYFVNSLGNPQDVLLFESKSIDSTFPCSAVCYNQDGTLLTSQHAYNPRFHRLCNAIPGAISFNISDQFICRGWDDLQAIAEDAEALLKPHKALVMLNSLYSEFSKFYKRLAELQQNLESIRGDLVIKEIDLLRVLLLTIIHSEITRNYLASFAKKFHPFMDLKTNIENSKNIYDSLINITLDFNHTIFRKNNYYENKIAKAYIPLVIKRNKSAIKAYESLGNHTGRDFSFFGRYHLISIEADKSKDYFRIGKDEPQFELREFLAKGPYAVLTPR
jgi:hypothetical protein